VTTRSQSCKTCTFKPATSLIATFLNLIEPV
jgi:hypothetical protein